MTTTSVTQRRFDEAAQEVAQAARWYRHGVDRTDSGALTIAAEWLETALASWEKARDEHSRALDEAAAPKQEAP